MMKILRACLILGLVFNSVEPTPAASASDLLEKGIYTEETKGELKTAIDIYQQILDQSGADRSLVAQAQLRLGMCELKLGNRSQAVSTLQRLEQEFPDRQQLLAVLENRMPQLLDEMVRQIEKNYIVQVDRGELVETALRAIIGKLGTQTGFLRTNDMAFLDAREVSQMKETIEQKIAGIGAELKETAGEVVVVMPLPNSPAFKGGLRAGDRIVKVDTVPLPDVKALETALKLIRGTPGSPVTLAVKRDGSPELLDIQLVRDIVHVSSVKGDSYKSDMSWEFMLNEQTKIGYIRLTYLGNESPKEMESALKELNSRGMKGLVLDLRDNPGGSLADAVSVADLFVESGRIVTVKRRDGEKAYDAVAEGTVARSPMAVLVNRQTASAAEIVAACLQDHGRAAIIGERTYGQALVRSIVPLEGGKAALKLPVAEYVRPSGKAVNRYPDSTEGDDWGVKPDEGMEFSLTDDELKTFEKYRSQRDAPQSNAPAIAFHDGQLDKAIEWLVAQPAP